MKLIVGGPVSRREWILPHWFTHVEAACDTVGVRPEYVFILDPADSETATIVRDHGALVIEHADDRPADTREWNFDRFLHMAALRNRVLETVRAAAPDLFWSLDSDVLTHPAALQCLIESTGRFDAVGGATFMTSAGTACPSWGMFTRNGGLRRDYATGVFSCQTIMASKLMTPAAYAVDYSAHTHGEDIGWSLNCQKAGVKLGFDGRVYSKHVMNPDALDRVDSRVGY